MVNIEEVRATNEQCLGEIEDLTAVFVPGTTGIGEYTLRRLAFIRGRHDKGFYAYLVARSQDKADAVIAECKEHCPKAEFCFIKTSYIALMSEVDRACQEIRKREEERRKGMKASIDLLILSPGKIELGPRKDTIEGLDRSMSLLYYSRIRFINNLLPLLVASTTHARVISIYAAGMEREFYPDDLSLRNNYTFAGCRTQVVHMKTLSFERIAKENKGRISLVHYFPRIVVTPAYDSTDMPMWFRIIWTVVAPVVRRFIAVPHDESGDRVLYLATERFSPVSSESGETSSKEQLAVSTDGVKGGGAYSVFWNDELNLQSKLDKSYESLRRDNMGEKVWLHTMSAFDTISAGKPFQG